MPHAKRPPAPERAEPQPEGAQPEGRESARLFQTRSQAWREVGLLRQISPQAVKRARVEALLLVPLFIGIVIVYEHRESLLGVDVPARIVAVVALLIIGWAIARDIGRALGPMLFRRLDPSTAGTVGFLIRLLTVGLALLIALRVAGLDPRTLAVGGALTAVVLGLAAQQTLGNVIAGTVLLSARPFKVGERVRLQGGPLAGQIDGVVSSLGLLYTTFATGQDSVMVPNSVVLGVAVRPLREPDEVNLRARLRAGITPSDLQDVLEGSLQTSLRDAPRITLEELDGDAAVVRIAATPMVAAEGRQLASEVLAIVSQEIRRADGAPDERDAQALERSSAGGAGRVP